MPDEEWFCRDCFVDHTQDNTQKYDAIDYSQHAIAFSDDELPPFEQQTRPTAGEYMNSCSCNLFLIHEGAAELSEIFK